MFSSLSRLVTISDFFLQCNLFLLLSTRAVAGAKRLGALSRLTEKTAFFTMDSGTWMVDPFAVSVCFLLWWYGWFCIVMPFVFGSYADGLVFLKVFLSSILRTVVWNSLDPAFSLSMLPVPVIVLKFCKTCWLCPGFNSIILTPDDCLLWFILCYVVFPLLFSKLMYLIWFA